ncbi:hypothetical protein AB2N04_18410 [Nitratireductor sp. GISD-1A_MAKvit]|uniref:hypothetical protein n=1 Tax=Nitratireductor sp. GISD-1A_MAKvit TaxID=3234198 RepID=UPI00346595E1
MPTNFASVHAHLENAQAELKGSDPATQQLREALGLLMDAALKAEFSPGRNTENIIQFPLARTTRHRPSSRLG